MWAKHKQILGFTIVELLIVIVVIAILAAITVVAYNGIQQKANNSKTTQALSSWVQGLKMYKADNGRWPNAWTCLGEGYLYGPSGVDSSGTSQCRNNVLSNTGFNNLMRPYFGGGLLPTPAFVTAYSTDTEWRRGIHYAYGGGDGTQVYIDVAYAGLLNSCPDIDGLNGSRQVLSGNTKCNYLIGSISDT